MENNNPQPKPQNNAPVQNYIPDTKVETKSHLDKLAAVFLPEDLNSVSNNIVDKVVIPSILKTAGEILHKSIDMIFGTNFTGVNTQSQTSSPVQNWTTYQQRNTSASSQPTGTMQILPVRNGVYDYTIVRFKTEEDAVGVLSNMRATLQNTGSVSVAAYLQFSGVKTLPEDFNYGWTNLTAVKLQNTRDGEYPYRMILPPPVVINKQKDEYYI
ncbi:MAG: hypothetical protein J6Y20_05535 [Lachnospiraceae bacterium]|nr:hypothetical protein [Lachnospiraceae bacterium]